MSTIGNIVWFLFGGFVAGLAWWFTGLVALITIVGIPWARSCFVLGKMSFLPFGKEVIARDELTQREDIGTGIFGSIGNILWFIFAGWWLALTHFLIAIAQAVTIILIPFALQHLKLAGASLVPVGKTVVDKHLAHAAKASNAEQKLKEMRS